MNGERIPTAAYQYPVVATITEEILEADGLKWAVTGGCDDAIGVIHETNESGHSIHDYITSQFKPGRVFLDIGAHAGHYTLRAAKAGCQVYAVEANPQTAALLFLNCWLNGLLDRVTIWAFAAWDRRTTVDVATAPGANFRNGSASVASPDGYVKSGLTVATLPLDQMLVNLDRVDVVKMDVEGADIHVLDGMAGQLARLKPLLIFEDHEFYGTYTRADMARRENRLTRDAGYMWQDATDLGMEMNAPERDRYRIGSVGS